MDKLEITIEWMINRANAAQDERDLFVAEADRRLTNTLYYIYGMGLEAGVIKPGEVPPWLPGSTVRKD